LSDQLFIDWVIDIVFTRKIFPVSLMWFLFDIERLSMCTVVSFTCIHVGTGAWCLRRMQNSGEPSGYRMLSVTVGICEHLGVKAGA
jgi:hypothetical protein